MSDTAVPPRNDPGALALALLTTLTATRMRVELMQRWVATGAANPDDMGEALAGLHGALARMQAQLRLMAMPRGEVRGDILVLTFSHDRDARF